MSAERNATPSPVEARADGVREAVAAERNAFIAIVRQVRADWINGESSTAMGRCYQRACDKILDALASLESTPAQPVHPDDLAVDRFAAAMKAKLAKKRADGRGGWERKDECSNEFLSSFLREHVEKGDPVDVGNLAMMIQQRGERIV